MTRVTVASCTDVPDFALDDDRSTIEALRAHGYDAQLVPWDAPDHDWAADDLVVIRSTWDYTYRREQFVAWAHAVPRLLNPASIVEWNTDKVYLRELEAAGIPIVPTLWSPSELPEEGEFVVKPTISAGARDTRRYTQEQRAEAQEHLARLSAEGVAMVQPYLSAVDTEGETALLFIGGRLSHAMRKGPILQRGAEALDKSTYSEEMSLREPTAAQLAVAEQVLAAVPGGAEQLLYARVDLLPDADGNPVLIELEATEPSLFLSYAEGAVDRLVAAIASRLD